MTERSVIRGDTRAENPGVDMVNQGSVCVVGLGDVGRSPRLQLHALSLADEGFSVDIIGYSGASPKPRLTKHTNVRLLYLPPVPEFNKYVPQLLVYVLKAVWQSLTLFVWLLFRRRSDHVLIQTPPAVPTLAVCWLYCVLAAAHLVIDWHNYAYSLMALTLGDSSPLVKLSYWFECYFGRKAHANMCVTKAMRLDLLQRWGILAKVVYDRPPEEFQRTSIQDRHQLFTRLSVRYPVLGGAAGSTAFTIAGHPPALRPDRPALLVSSTSWTEDEDFNILLSALIDYDKSPRQDIPNLICAITGKGPLKDHYISIVLATKWNRVSIITPWLEPEDYPLLLGCADLGVSLHTSSSGLDLPMKIVDMFGCGLPVLAHDFRCVGELVQDGENGYVFRDAEELSVRLIDWFKGFPECCSSSKHAHMHRHIEAFQTLRWHQNWALNALPLFK